MIKSSNKKFATPTTRIKHEPNKPANFAGWINEKHRIAWVISPHRSESNDRNSK